MRTQYSRLAYCQRYICDFVAFALEITVPSQRCNHSKALKTGQQKVKSQSESDAPLE